MEKRLLSLEGIGKLLVLLDALLASAQSLHRTIHLEVCLGGAIFTEDFPAD